MATSEEPDASKISRSALSGILAFAIDNGTLTTNVLRQIRAVKTQGVKTPIRKRDTTRALTRDEREQVLAYADKLTLCETINLRPRRNREAVADLMAFMAGIGIRINEARELRWDDIDLDAGAVHARGTKTRASDRRLSLPPWLAEKMKARAKRLDANGLVFSSPHHLNEPERVWDQSNSAKALARVFIESGLPWATPHTLRRTVATILDQSGVPIAKIADQLGHTDPAMTTRVYLGRDLMGDKAEGAAFL